MKIFGTAAECGVVGERDDEYLLSFLVSERQISWLEVPICHNIILQSEHQLQMKCLIISR